MVLISPDICYFGALCMYIYVCMYVCMKRTITCNRKIIRIWKTYDKNIRLKKQYRKTLERTTKNSTNVCIDRGVMRQNTLNHGTFTYSLRPIPIPYALIMYVCIEGEKLDRKLHPSSDYDVIIVHIFL